VGEGGAANAATGEGFMKHAFARKLRREQTDAERKSWFALRGRRFSNFKFRRRQPIGPYIADFSCFEAKLVIELDGGQHGSDEELAYDGTRTKRLERDGFRVLRFPNHEINSNFDGVLDRIAHALSLPI
jgi:adenine-specific DNA-methyltransferase